MILIGLGSNTPSAWGAPAATLQAALSALADCGVRVTAVSRFYASPAWPDPSDPPYVNAVAAVETTLAPAELLALLHRVEARFGRERRARNAPRTLDLDIIDFEGRVESGGGAPDLPHPRAQERSFVLAPLLDVAPEWVHPASGRTGRELLAAAELGGSKATPLD